MITYGMLEIAFILILFCVPILLQCLRRYILNCTMADTSGSNWFTFFNETVDTMYYLHKCT